MRISESPEDRRFREEAREWLAANVPATRRPADGGDEQRDFDVAWRRRQFEGGWGHIAWPADYGGRGLSLAHQLIWYEECARAKAPGPVDMFFVALQHAGPTLIARGDEQQRDLHLPMILRGEAIWSQGFSEPGAGSDLAAIRTRGVVDGDSLVVTGQKVWTSFGRYARFQELLVRTDSLSARHQGLTFAICDMASRGIDIRPIRNLAGGDDFCEVFYDEVRIPKGNVVGGLGNGWDVALSTLAFERGAASIPQAMELAQSIEELVNYVDAQRADRRPRSSGLSALESRLAAARADAAALKSMIHLVIAQDHGSSQGSLVRLYLSELAQRVASLAMDVLGAASLERSALGGWPLRYLIAFKHTIAGGTAEIQRNIIGERILGLPRGGRER
jgi:alkylation response protein AidB-like acyl-CoA dehydrogenase